jgi:putative polyhydroxyalkanoate system protein
MADIRMIKYHSLPMAQARALVQQAADDLAEEYDLTSQWAGNTLHFRRSGVQGEMRVTDSEIDLEVTLGFLLKAFKSKFVEHIEHNFERLLAKAHADHKPARAAAKAPEKAPARSKAPGHEKAPARVARKATRKS